VTKDKLFHKDYAKELLNIAKGDFESAEILASASKGRKENICFTAQQCIEKTLKAVICARGQPIPLTHTIELLLDRLGKNFQPPHGDSLIELTDFATVRRYQEGSEIISAEDVSATIDAAASVLAWGTATIAKLLG
jgi:HEPN domain-containing protein